jgi:hypothetical protein
VCRVTRPEGRATLSVLGSDRDTDRPIDGQFPLGQRPDSLIRVEFPRARGEMLDVETGMLRAELARWLPLVSLRVVQDRNGRPRQVSQQMAEEHARLFLPDVLEVELDRGPGGPFGLTAIPGMTGILSRR